MLGYTLFVIVATSGFIFLSSKLQDPLFLIQFQLDSLPLLGLIVFMAIFLIMVFFSNRIAGPLYRLRSEMKKVADGAEARPVHFRKSDLFKVVADQYNELLVKRMK